MPIMFNTILRDAGLPLSDVRLLRHKHNEAKKERQLQAPWKDRKGGAGNEPDMRTGWLTFHDRKWLTLKRPLTGISNPSVARSSRAGRASQIKGLR